MPLEGATELRQLLQQKKTDAPKALGAALMVEGIEIIGDADKDVPYEFGHLRRSHFVEQPKPGSKGPEVEFGYGAGYGLYVHEVPATHPKGGKDHWLRDAVNRRISSMPERLAARIEARPRGGFSDLAGLVPSLRPDPMEAINAERADRERSRRRGRARAIRAQNARRGRR